MARTGATVSELALGAGMLGNRDEYFLVSKYGRTASTNPSTSAYGSSRKAMTLAVEASLTRLGTDHIDLYMPHFDDGVTPIDEIMLGLEHLVSSGKILYAGFSNAPAWRIAAAAVLADERKWAPVTAIEVEYNLLQRTTEQDILPMAKAFGLGVFAYSPLARAVLAKRGDRTPNVNGDTGAVLAVVDRISGQCMQTPAAVAIAWLKYQGVIPILGATTAKQMQQNLLAAEFHLTAQQVDELDGAVKVLGGYPHELLALQAQRQPQQAHPRT